MTNEEKANLWMDKNPEAYAMFSFFALQACFGGHKFGAKAVAERVRWETKIQSSMLGSKEPSAQFKWPNTHTSYVAKKFIAEHPQFEDRIQFRGQHKT